MDGLDCLKQQMENKEIKISHDTPINVCLVSLEVYPLFNPSCGGSHGGTEIDAYMIGTELAKDSRFKVTCITANSCHLNEEIINGIRLIKCDGLNKNIFAAGVSLWQAMKYADCDLYFRETPTLPTFLTALFCRLKHKLFAYRCASANNCNGGYIREHWFRGRLYKWALKQAAVVMVQNLEDIDSLRQTTGVDSACVPNGHHLAPLAEQPRDGILWVGRSTHVKRPELFIELAKQIPSQRFVMVCEQCSENRHYNRLVGEAQQVSNIEFHKSVPFAKINSFFQCAKIFVNTSDFEGFPNTFVQACAAGTPILSLNTNPDGFLEKYKCGLCSKGNWADFVRHVTTLLDSKIQSEYGQNGRKYAAENHDIEKIIEQYKKLFIAAKKN